MRVQVNKIPEISHNIFQTLYVFLTQLYIYIINLSMPNFIKNRKMILVRKGCIRSSKCRLNCGRRSKRRKRRRMPEDSEKRSSGNIVREEIIACANRKKEHKVVKLERGRKNNRRETRRRRKRRRKESPTRD